MVSYDSQWLLGIINWRDFTLSSPDSFLSMLLWSNTTYYPSFLGQTLVLPSFVSVLIQNECWFEE